MTGDPLRIFHPLVRQWFVRRIGVPTEGQRLAWPRIADREHVLLSAPTGTGKTLAAFLWSIDELVRGAWSSGAVRVLYVSPLRALNNDIRRNLVLPLAELERAFSAEGATMPRIRAATRSGDTPASERRRMLRQPPEILITTPESLNILLTSKSGVELLGDLETVILDEVHAVAGNRRGTHLITAVERLTRLSGEFQRVALSATVRPLDRIASWVGGFEIDPSVGDPTYRPRPVTTIDAGGRKEHDVSVRYLKPAGGWPEPGVDGLHPVWPAVATAASERIADNRSTLIFANSRRTVERLARLVNGAEHEPLVYSHHGSLSREIREVVEERLKDGQLKGIVATNTLELGIDVGAIDEVVLVGTPPSIASSIQRVGRAGHQVGETSRAVLYPIHRRDVIDAAVTVRGLLDGDVEPIAPPEAPLDVLAQVLLSMTATEEWSVDELYGFLRASDPYRGLSRRAFDLVIEMLLGRYEGTRLPELRARLSIDRARGTIRARPGSARLIYAAGGTIPDRGYFKVRLADTRALVGELDEEFVWERSEGETITLGVQSWRIEQIGRSDVLVSPTGSRKALAPFWQAEDRAQSRWFAERLGCFLEWVDSNIGDPSIVADLERRHRLDHRAAEELVAVAESQRAATGVGLPHRHHLVLERIEADARRPDRAVTVLHTMWGGRVNRALAVALAGSIEERAGVPVETAYDDGCVALELAEPLSADELLGAFGPQDVERLVRGKLQTTGLFGARFRECAGRALLLPRAGFGKRTPLWQSRQRAKELLAAVSSYGDFPILLEAWRSCLTEELDLDSLTQLIAEVADGSVAVSEAVTHSPSPFADEAIYRRINALMYEDDTPPGRPAGPRADLIDEVIFSPGLRPRIPDEVIAALEAKLKRVAPGYAPRDADDLCDWVGERALVPAEEWQELLTAVCRDREIDPEDLVAGVRDRVVAVGPSSGEPWFVCCVEDLSRLRTGLGLGGQIRITSLALDGSEPSDLAAAALEHTGQVGGLLSATDSPAEVLAEWLRFYGPLTPDRARRATGIESVWFEAAIAELERDGRVVVDELSEHADGIEVCDAGNLGRLLRLARSQRPAFQTRPADELPLFMATWQGLGAGSDREGLEEALDRLLGLPAPVGMWEEEILPARVDPYRTAWLDGLMTETDLMWFGCDQKRVTFALEAERELFVGPEHDASDDDRKLRDETLPDLPGRFTTTDLLTQNSRVGSAELSERLWSLAWHGSISNDSFAVLRQGAASGFDASTVADAGRSRSRTTSRSRMARWRASRPLAGSWYRLAEIPAEADALALEELRRDRVRALLERYGVLFRNLLARELPVMRWDELSRTLRVLELAGEVVGGRFFDGVPGLQFIAPRALRSLERGLDEDRVFWLNAADPASFSGLHVDGLELPRRAPTTHLVFHGRRLVLVSERRGRRLDVRCDSDEPRLADYLRFLDVLLTREANPLRTVLVEEICGEPAASSDYRRVLDRLFDVEADHKHLRLRRKR